MFFVVPKVVVALVAGCYLAVVYRPGFGGRAIGISHYIVAIQYLNDFPGQVDFAGLGYMLPGTLKLIK